MVLFSVWFLAAVAALYYYSVHAGREYVKHGDNLALRKGVITAPRGTLFDKNGLKLAWTESRYDLVLSSIPKYPLRKKHLFDSLHKVLGVFEPVEQVDCFVITENLSPDLYKQLESLIFTYQELNVRLRYERLFVTREFQDYSILSGLEQEYDGTLKGVAGEYVVMVDSLGNLVPGTWKLEKPVVAGEDVVIEESYAAIKERIGGYQQK